MLEYLKVGQIISAHGVRGEVKVYPLTENIKRFSRLKHTYIKKNNEFIKYAVESVKYINKFVVVKLSGIEQMNEAEKYIDEYLYVDRENAVKLSRDEYFIADLIGINVYSTEGESLGTIISVFPTGSNDVYEIKTGEGKTFLVPAIKDVVKEVDIDNRKMFINLIEGLI